MSRRRSRSTLSFSLFAFQDIITAVTGISLLITMILALALVRSKRVLSDVPTQKTELETLRAEVEGLEEQIDLAEEALAKNARTISYQPTNSVDLKVAIRAAEITNANLKSQQRLFNHELQVVKSKDIDDVKALIESEQADLAAKRKQNKRSEGDLQEEVNGLVKRLAEVRTGRRFFFNPPDGFAKTPMLLETSGDGIRVGYADGRSKGPPISAKDFVASLKNYDRTKEYFVVFVHPGGIRAYDQISGTLSRYRFDHGVDLLGHKQFILGDSH